MRSEEVTVDRQSGAGWHSRPARRFHDQGVEPPHLLLQNAVGGFEAIGAEGIATNELGELVGAMDGSLTVGSHLDEMDRNAPSGDLPGRFDSREPASDHGDVLHLSV